MSKKKIARKPRSTKRAAPKPLPPPQPYLVTATGDTVERIVRMAFGEEGDIAGPESVEYKLAQELRAKLDTAIERATPKPAAEVTQIERARIDVENAKGYLDDVPGKFLEVVAATQDGSVPGEPLAELAGLLEAVRNEIAGALEVLSESEARP